MFKLGLGLQTCTFYNTISPFTSSSPDIPHLQENQ